MCFYKEGAKSEVLEEDLYVGKIGDVSQQVFISDVKNFLYVRQKLYKKSLWHKIRAGFRNILEGEVYHSFTPCSILKRVATSPSILGYVGVFVIPKGTRIYRNNEVIVSFATRYVGPYVNNTSLLLE